MEEAMAFDTSHGENAAPERVCWPWWPGKQGIKWCKIYQLTTRKRIASALDAEFYRSGLKEKEKRR